MTMPEFWWAYDAYCKMNGVEHREVGVDKEEYNRLKYLYGAPSRSIKKVSKNGNS